MDSSKFEVRIETPNTTTRPNGAAARVKLKQLLARNDTVVVDLVDVVITPSFADEFLGVLLSEIGPDSFRKSVQIVNVPVSARSLLSTILSRRMPVAIVDSDRHRYA